MGSVLVVGGRSHAGCRGHPDVEVAGDGVRGPRQNVLDAMRVRGGRMRVLHLRHGVESGQRRRAGGLQEAQHGSQHRSAPREGLARRVTEILRGRRGEYWSLTAASLPERGGRETTPLAAIGGPRPSLPTAASTHCSITPTLPACLLNS